MCVNLTSLSVAIASAVQRLVQAYVPNSLTVRSVVQQANECWTEQTSELVSTVLQMWVHLKNGIVPRPGSSRSHEINFIKSILMRSIVREINPSQ